MEREGYAEGGEPLSSDIGFWSGRLKAHKLI
jgi:hypothetical protein